MLRSYISSQTRSTKLVNAAHYLAEGSGCLELIPWMGLALVRISFSLVASSHSLLLYVDGSSGPTRKRERSQLQNLTSKFKKVIL